MILCFQNIVEIIKVCGIDLKVFPSYFLKAQGFGFPEVVASECTVADYATTYPKAVPFSKDSNSSVFGYSCQFVFSS